MSFCSFSKDFSGNTTTQVHNAFITEYLTNASGDAVKIYLYGLYLCTNSAVDMDIDKFAAELDLSTDVVKDCFLFWEEFGILTIISEEPYSVKYLSLSKNTKPRKFKAEKYTEFNKHVQTLITERMISTSEYSEYFSIMEDYQVKPEALLLIIKYCVDLKGENVGFRYVTAVAKDFINRGLTTCELIEQELSEYVTRTNDIQAILSALSIKRKADIDDLKLFNKWKQDFAFEMQSILFVAKKLKLRNMDKLDQILLELYVNKAFSQKEIDGYLLEKSQIKQTAQQVAKNLSVYCEVIDPYVTNYISPWTNKGYNQDALIFIANYCFKKKRKSFEEMNETVEHLYSLGYVTLDSIVGYITSIATNDEFIKELLSLSFCERKPNKWDRELLSHWREWGFSDEMLKRAASLSSGKTNPFAYMNVVLSSWKAQNVFTPDKIPPQNGANGNGSEGGQSAIGVISTKQAPKFGTEHEYTQEDFNKIFTKIEDVDF